MPGTSGGSLLLCEHDALLHWQVLIPIEDRTSNTLLRGRAQPHKTHQGKLRQKMASELIPILFHQHQQSSCDASTEIHEEFASHLQLRDPGSRDGKKAPGSYDAIIGSLLSKTVPA